MSYIYHYHCKIEGGTIGAIGVRKTYFTDGLYKAAKKIVDEETYLSFKKLTYENLKLNKEHYHEKDLQVISLNFLHEVEE